MRTNEKTNKKMYSICFISDCAEWWINLITLFCTKITLPKPGRATDVDQTPKPMATHRSLKG
jgi:hypothetical protein